MKKSELKKLKRFCYSVFEAQVVLSETLSEMQDRFDSRSERWQESEKGQALQNAISYLENVVNELQSSCYTMEDILAEYEYE